MSSSSHSNEETNSLLNQALLVHAVDEDDISNEERKNKIKRAIVQLYVSHTFSRWGNRMWEFAVAIFFMEIWPSSLSLVALYGLIEASAVALFGSALGKWVDRTSRIKAVSGALIAQNVAILLAAVTVSRLLITQNASEPDDTSNAVSNPVTLRLSTILGFDTSNLEFYVLVMLTNVLGGVAALAALAESVSVERDWVIVLAEEAERVGFPTGQLALINTAMRRIDLTCKLVGPIAVGIIISAASALPAAILIASWNVLSVFVEFSMLHLTYAAIPSLSHKEHRVETILPASVPSDEESKAEIESASQKHEQSGLTFVETESDGSQSWFQNFLSGWKIYIKQTTFLPALSISLLYFTVLSFGSMMTAELTWRGVSALVLSLARGAAAVTGLGGTVIFPLMEKQISALRTGLWSIWMQWFFLLFCVLSIFVSLDLGSLFLILGVIGSRTGLWMFDLAVTQLMQESVAENERGIVGGVHGSLQQFCNLACYAVGLFVSDPVNFWILIDLSFFMVTCSAFLYMYYCYTVRGHIFHFNFWFNKH